MIDHRALEKDRQKLLDQGEDPGPRTLEEAVADPRDLVVQLADELCSRIDADEEDVGTDARSVDEILPELGPAVDKALGRVKLSRRPPLEARIKVLEGAIQVAASRLERAGTGCSCPGLKTKLNNARAGLLLALHSEVPR